ncbi:MAG: PadR family transcriptional regulator [Rhodospirillaceae bacterium]|nr:PadR family transcriptional regulator [Rhodospirillaceae bacterium]MBT6139513.1 PadR family transcriptional regulator [Rhodospirillaceae bacterium]
MDVKTCCLAALLTGEATGYEIKKMFEEGPFAHFQSASFGSIYPSLTALRKAGMVSVSTATGEGRPDKKVYVITEAGRAELLEKLEITPGRDQIRSDFLFLMFFSELQAPDRIGDLIDQRRAYFDQALDDIARVEVESPAGPGRAFVRGFGKAIYTAALRYLSDNQKPLLDELTTNHGSRPDAGGGNGPDAEHDNKTTQAAE